MVGMFLGILGTLWTMVGVLAIFGVLGSGMGAGPAGVALGVRVLGGLVLVALGDLCWKALDS